MSLLLHQYHHPADGWEAALQPWLASAGTRILRGEEVWLIAPNRLAAHWVRQCWVTPGQIWLGIRTLEPWSLRRELAARLRLSYDPLGRESLELFLRFLARGPLSNDPLAQRVATSPGAALSALDELGQAGWSSTESALERTGLAKWLQALEEIPGWMPNLDAQLLNKPRDQNAQPLHLFFWGWDQNQASAWRLLVAAIRQATTAVIASPAPRFEGRDTEADWINFLASNLCTEPQVCPESTSRTQSPPQPYPLPAQTLLEGADALLSALRNPIQNGLRTGILLEEGSPLSPTIRRRLHELQLPFFDDLGTPAPATPSWAARLAWVRYHATGNSLPAAVELWTTLSVQLGVTGLAAPATFEKQLRAAFRQVQCTRLPALLQAANQENIRQLLGSLAPNLEPWPDELTGDQAIQRLSDFDRAIGANPLELQPLARRLQRVAGNCPIPTTDLCRFLEDSLQPGGLLRPETANNPFANLILTTRRAALHQTWDALAFTDANEGIWPRTPFENPFLPDSTRSFLNQKASPSTPRLPLSTDRAADEREQVARLIESCKTTLPIAYLLRDPSDPQRTIFPNEIVSRWAKSPAPTTAPLPPRQVATNFPNIQEFARVHASRRDPAHPFDEWLWVVGPLPDHLRPWNPSSLDDLRHRPATFLLRWLFQAERSWGEPWERSQSMAVGTLTHRWLAAAFNGAGPADPESWSKKLRGEFEATVNQVPPDPWWQSVVAEAWSFAGAMARAAAPFLNTHTARTEQPIQGQSLGPFPLPLSGQADLVLEAPEGKIIADYKTHRKTKVPSLKQILKPDGDGLQFAAYLALFSQGSSPTSVGLINRHGIWEQVLAEDDLDKLSPVFAHLHAIRQHGRFTQGKSANEHSHTGETLPFACQPLSGHLLDEKKKLDPVGKSCQPDQTHQNSRKRGAIKRSF